MSHVKKFLQTSQGRRKKALEVVLKERDLVRGSGESDTEVTGARVSSGGMQMLKLLRRSSWG